ncbi:MAG: rod shape-determining protein MreD [Chloroflexi bacterium]|nr:rod shape-determining protein MreD [Chloroflexota bacterium]
MRRHIFAAITLTFLAVLEAVVLPRLFGSLPRPNLVLIIACTWSALRMDEGFVWALGGGLLLDVFSSTPFGTHTAALIVGNLAALILSRFPLPAEFFRVTNWVAFATIPYHLVQLGFLRIDQRPFDGTLALSGTILPLLVLNPLLSLGAYALLSPLQIRLNEEERFARRV